MKNIEVLEHKVREEVYRTNGEKNAGDVIIDVLVREGVDLRNGPSLEQLKQLLVEAMRTAEACRCVAC